MSYWALATFGRHQAAKSLKRWAVHSLRCQCLHREKSVIANHLKFHWEIMKQIYSGLLSFIKIKAQHSTANKRWHLNTRVSLPSLRRCTLPCHCLCHCVLVLGCNDSLTGEEVYQTLPDRPSIRIGRMYADKNQTKGVRWWHIPLFYHCSELCQNIKALNSTQQVVDPSTAKLSRVVFKT